MTTTVFLDSQNKVMLPDSIREKYHLQPGDSLSILDQGDGKIVLEPPPSKGIEDVRAAFDAFVNREEIEPMSVKDAVKKHLEEKYPLAGG